MVFPVFVLVGEWQINFSPMNLVANSRIYLESALAAVRISERGHLHLVQPSCAAALQ